ncbi:MAG: lytic transglycosylase domain-containing protein, partial [Polaromonas sp.]
MLYKFLNGPVRAAALPPIFSAIACLTLLVPATAQTAIPASASAADNVIVEMNKAFKRGDKARMAQLLPQARGHALEPWAAYWELKARLGEASAQEVQDFFGRYAGTYQEDRLRNDWLLLLGQRRDWAGFAAEYPNYRMNDDKEVRCYALLVENLRNPVADARLADEVKKNWYAQREADDGCNAAAERLVNTKILTPQDAWVKARLATEANRPRAATAAVQIVAPDAVGMVNDLNASPIKFLAGKHLAISKARREIITLALIKLAISDTEGAAFQLENKWGMQLNTEERNWVWGAIGRQAATRLGTVPAGDALQYFAKVTKDSDLTDDMLAWKARSALRAGTQPNWPLVLAAVNAMSEETRKEPTWSYWKARALLATAPPDAAPKTPVVVATTPGVTQTISTGITISPQRAEALALMQSFASVRGFYEQLALEELGQKITVPARPAALAPEEKEAARLNPGLNRAAYAIAIGLRPEGTREWNYTTNLHKRGGMSDRELLAAAQFACDRQIWDRCI